VVPYSLPPKDALEYWGEKVRLKPADYRALTAEAKVKAFAVAGIAKEDEIATAYRSIEKAIAEGTTLKDFQEKCAGIFEKRGWTGERAHRVDTIFRTNIQTAYSVGRWRQMRETSKSRPYGQYDAVGDKRTRPTHAAQDGKVYPMDHPYWDTWWPPNGHRCRCGVISLSEAEVAAQGLTVETEDPTGKLIEPIDPVTRAKLPARLLMPDVGFDVHPGKNSLKSLGRLMGEKLIDQPPALASAVVTARYRQPLMRAEYEEWIDGLADELKSGEPKGKSDYRVVGALSKDVLGKLSEAGIGPETGAVIVSDRRVYHLLRLSKTASVDIKDLKALPDILNKPEAVLWDKRNKTILYVFTGQDPAKKGKFVVGVNRNVKLPKNDQGKRSTQTVNEIVTAGMVDLVMLTDTNMYDVWSGELK
jgi:SPP1 gp7 family putative phage head morphogenesis protein